MELFSLGNLYPSDFLAPAEEPRSAPVDLKLLWDENTHRVRLEKVADSEFMYGRYWYRSGINNSMRAELRSIVESIMSVKKLTDGDIWLDIACNDGTLLSFVPENIRRIGIDPADDSFVVDAVQHAETIIQDYFSARAYPLPYKTASVVTCIAMFYDLEDPIPFLRDVDTVMKDDGLFVLQLSYTPLMLEQLAFDNICHEHIHYYTLTTLSDTLSQAGFRVVDCQLNDVNGGSFRVYAMKDTANPRRAFGTQPYRDVCAYRVQSLLEMEESTQVNYPNVWMDFIWRVDNLKHLTVDFIRREKANGKKIWGYGASTKGNTLLQYFGLDHTLIDGIAERSPYKFGLRTVGTNIPIYSEEEMREAKPDYLLVLPWHFISEFVEREQEFLDNGGQFIVPCPVFEVIGK